MVNYFGKEYAIEWRIVKTEAAAKRWNTPYDARDTLRVLSWSPTARKRAKGHVMMGIYDDDDFFSGILKEDGVE